MRQASPDPGALGPGSELGPYRLERLLGAGGMGEVYLAKHQTLGREVAIKILNPDAASHPDIVRRLFAEAHIVNEVNHENIVEVHDFVTDAGGRSYYVMELLRGEDLAAARLQGAFTVERTLSIALQICSALQATHEKGVVHRDLKPENVFLVERAGQKDFVKLIDFGVAKVFDETLRNGSFTRVGTIVGTPEYMSPEQAGARAIDGRSDVYTLGLLLYWMLSDRLPFTGSGFDKLILARLTTQPPDLLEPTPAGQRVPRALAKVVLRCLELEPNDRFQTMADLARALSEVKLDLAAPATATLDLRRPRPAILAAAAALALLAAGLFLLFHGRSPSEAPAEVTTAAVAPSQPAPPPVAPRPPSAPTALPPPPPVLTAHEPIRPPKRPIERPSKPVAADAKPSKTRSAPAPRPSTRAAPTEAKPLPPGIIDPFNE